MGKPGGFLEIRERELPSRRSVEERITDWNEVYLDFPVEKLRAQASRCMDCGIPFCHNGCPLGNIIPDFNDLAYRDRWEDALERLHRTNNFPEFTGKLCPAPCEASCVLGINEPPVTIKNIELSIITKGFEMGLVKPQPPKRKTGKKVAIIGSGPAGLACAQQLARVGHEVTVYERSDKIGGLMRYGIPEFKMEKWVLDRRLEQMEAEGVRFVVNAHVGVNTDLQELREQSDALVLCGGASHPRDLSVPGRDLKGVHFAVDYLTQANRASLGETVEDQILATDKHVIILGGGDTGADCLGTAVRQGATSIKQFELLPRPPKERAPNNPWPEWPRILMSASAHEECEVRDYSIETTELSGENGVLKKLHARRLKWVPGENGGRPKPEPIEGSSFEEPCDLLFLAMGFLGSEKRGLMEQLGVKLTERQNVWHAPNRMTSVTGVFTAGDMARGQSLIVWAIAEGRAAARGVDEFLMGTSNLPAPI